MSSRVRICESRRLLAFCLAVLAMLVWTDASQAVLLWSDLGTTQVQETGPGTDILGRVLRRNSSSSDTLYFKFHVDPVSDANTELYSAAFQLLKGPRATGSRECPEYLCLQRLCPGTNRAVQPGYRVY